MFAGLSIVERDTEEQEFLQEIGIPIYEFDSKTGIGTLDRVINDSVNNFLPIIIKGYKKQAANMRRRGVNEKLIRSRIKERIRTKFTKMKVKRNKVSAKAGDDPGYIKALVSARRLPLAKQQRAITEIESKRGYDIDLSSTADLKAIAKIARKFK